MLNRSPTNVTFVDYALRQEAGRKGICGLIPERSLSNVAFVNYALLKIAL